MLKKLLIVAALAAPISLVAQQKLGSVNSLEIFNLMPEKKTAEATLAEVSKRYDNEYQLLQDEFNRKYADYQDLTEGTPASISERSQQEIRELDSKMQSFENVAGDDLQRQQKTLLGPLQERLNTAIKAVGLENGYSYIFDVSVPGVLYTGADATDITPLVKVKLNLADPASVVTPATTTTPAATQPANTVPAATLTPATPAPATQQQ